MLRLALFLMLDLLVWELNSCTSFMAIMFSIATIYCRSGYIFEFVKNWHLYYKTLHCILACVCNLLKSAREILTNMAIYVYNFYLTADDC